MKQLISLLMLTFVCSTLFAQNKKTDTVTIQTKIYCDHCLQCSSCGANITNAIYATSGIKKININPEENTIRVVYNPAKTTPEKIRVAIADAGFDADDIKASAPGYAKLDGCCKAP